MANTFQLIDKTTLTGTQLNVTFTSIDQTYTDLKLIYSGRSSANDWTNGANLSFNGNRTTSQKRIYGLGSSVTSDSSLGNGQGEAGFNPAATATSSTFGTAEIYIPNYRSSSQKSYFLDFSSENNSSSLNVTGFFACINATTTTAINSITITDNGNGFVSGSSFYLYGIKNS